MTVKQTIGGVKGHWMRRLVHVTMIILPVLYFHYGAVWAGFLALTPVQLLMAVLLVILLFEALRLHFGWLLFGQRAHERYLPSSFVWGAGAICITMAGVPGGYENGFAFALPLIAVLAIVDPLVGECRRLQCPAWLVACIGYWVGFVIWALAAWHFQFSLWSVPIMPAVAVAAEWPQLKCIDDNAAMLLLPLLVLWGLYSLT